MDVAPLPPRAWWPQHSLDQLQPPAGLRPWLLHTGSLTRRLQVQWPDLQICLVHVGTGRLTSDEARRLDRPPNTPAWIRCASLRADGRTRIRARAVIPDWHAYNPWSPVADLGERPLGPWLFQQRGLLRSPFEWAPPPDDPRNEGCWARRSSFLRHGAPLLLTEWMVDLLDTADPHPSEQPTPLTA